MTETLPPRRRAPTSAGDRSLKLRPLALTALCVLLGLSSQSASAQVPEDTVRIAILPMRVHSSESRDYLRAGLIDMLASRLEQIDAIEVIRVDDPAKATTSYRRASDTGRELGVDYVLFGSFTQFGQGASLDVQVAAIAAGEAPMTQIFVQSGTMGDVIPDLDDLVGKISRFAVRDFDTRASAEPPLPGAPKREALAGLRERVNELEAAMRRLDPSFESEDVPPTDGSVDGESAEGDEAPGSAAMTAGEDVAVR